MTDSGITFRSQELGAQQSARSDQYAYQTQRDTTQTLLNLPNTYMQMQEHQMRMSEAQSKIASEEMRRQELQQKMQLTSYLRQLDVEGTQAESMKVALETQKFQLEQAKRAEAGEFSTDQILQMASRDDLPLDFFTKRGDSWHLDATPEKIRAWREQRRSNRSSAQKSSAQTAVANQIGFLEKKAMDPIFGGNDVEARLNQLYDLQSRMDSMSDVDIHKELVALGGPPKTQESKIATEDEALKKALPPEVRDAPPDWMHPQAGQVYISQLSKDPEFVNVLSGPELFDVSQYGDGRVAQSILNQIGRSYGYLVTTGMTASDAKAWVMNAIQNNDGYLKSLFTNAGFAPERVDNYLKILRAKKSAAALEAEAKKASAGNNSSGWNMRNKYGPQGG